MPSVNHAGRRERLASRLESLGLDGLLVTGRVNVRYLTGFTGSNGQVLLTGPGGFLFTDPRYEDQAGREAPGLDLEIYRDGFPSSVAGACRIAQIHRLGFESAGVTHRTWSRLGEIEGVELIPTEDEVERLRWAKEAEELERVERAQDITDQAFDRISGKLIEGVTEREVAAELEVAMRQIGAERVAFDTIVAFGEGAAEPHHRPSDRPLGRGDLVTLDFGCVVDGYHSDMTRTVAFGEPKPHLREVYAVVALAQRAGIQAVRAGATGGDVDEAARAVIRDAGYGDRFGHGLGHGVGLDIHEGPSLRAGGGDVVPAGAVVTVEPGIYLSGVGGVRIEDMVTVEPQGGRSLPAASKELLVL
jgi:Xaa-Pro aminopeptidase